MTAEPTGRVDPDRVEPALLRRWLTIVTGSDGLEHAVLSDGRHHIRLDVDRGTLAGEGPVLLHYHLAGVVGAEPVLLSLRRFLHLYHHHRFAAGLFPADRQVARAIELLRVHDALCADASQREIARILFGHDFAESGWTAPSDSLRSRVRRRVREARRMAGGGFRSLMGKGGGSGRS